MPTKRQAKVIGVSVTSGLLLAALVPLTSVPAAASTRVVPAAAIARAKATPVFVVGDSLTVGAKPYLRAKLRSHVGPHERPRTWYVPPHETPPTQQAEPGRCLE